MALKEITPHQLRCGIDQCLGVFEDGPQDLVIIGKALNEGLLNQLVKRIGADEYAIRVSRAIFAKLIGQLSQKKRRRRSRSFLLLRRRRTRRMIRAATAI